MNTATEDYRYYNPSVTELRQAYEVAYGDEFGAHHLVGAMFASMSETAIERVYKAALDTIKSELVKKGLA